MDGNRPAELPDTTPDVPPPRSLTRDALLLTGAKAATLALSFLALTWLLAHRLPRAEVGLFQQTSLWFAFVVPLAGFNLADSLGYFLPRCASREAARGLVTRTLLAVSALGLLLAGVTALMPEAPASWLCGRPEPRVAALLRTAAPVAWASMVVLAVESAAVAAGRVRSYAWFAVGASLAGCALVVHTLLQPSPTPQGVVAANRTGMLVTAGGAVVLAAACGWLGRGASPVTWREQWRYVWPLWLMGIVGQAGGYAAQLAMSRHGSSEAFAAFRYGATELPPLLIVSTAFLSALMPRIAAAEARGRRDESLALWHTGIRRLAVVFVPVVLCLGVLAEPFVFLVFTRDYVETIPVFRIYLGVTAVRMLAFHAVYQGTGHTRAFFAATLLYPALNLPLAFALVRWGSVGPAVANLAATLATNGLHVAVVARCLRVPAGRVLPWGFLARIVLAGLAAGVPLLAAEAWIGDAVAAWGRGVLAAVLPSAHGRLIDGGDVVRLAGGGLLYMAAYVPLVWLSGLVSAEERAAVKRWMKGRTGRS